MKKLYAFSKYIFFSVGGAEKSMLEVLKKKKASEYEISIVGVENLNNFNSNKYEIPNSLGWKKVPLSLKFQLNKFSYLEYCLNKKYIKRFFKELDQDAELVTYGFYAPAAALGFKGSSTIYLRSETDIGINANYYYGFKRFLKFIHILLEYPFYLNYKNDLKSSYARSKLIFNSEWMANECKNQFSANGKIEYPTIDFELLKRSYQANSEKIEKGIVFIGDSEIKGLGTVLKMAYLLKEQMFYIFTRHISSKIIEKNITYMPWSSDSSFPYLHAKLLIVPSVWNEAYGRVSVEAQFLGIPVLVSNRGGLPETVKYDKNKIIIDYLNPEVWAEKIKEICK
jgi:glycosyltransferase involved in cell wall biosynthesis